MKQHNLQRSLLAGLVLAASSNALGEVNIDFKQTSVSGLSSGGYMATQFQFAHADTLIGAGIVAAGPYYCAQNSISTAISKCVTETADDFTNSPLLAYFKEQQSLEKLASPEAIGDQKVLIIHGDSDSKINRKAVNLLVKQYQQLINDDVRFVTKEGIEHVFPTLDQGGACTESSSPFIGNCGYDAAGEILTYLYGELNPPVDANINNLQTVSQAESLSVEDAYLADNGFAYVPNDCQNGQQCRVHISFHGCNQSSEDVGNTYATKTGFNRWAESNNIIVFYPQIKKSSLFPMNPQGCWDWWGYTDSEYATKEGKQIQAIHKLLFSLPVQLERK